MDHPVEGAWRMSAGLAVGQQWSPLAALLRGLAASPWDDAPVCAQPVT